MGVLCWDSFGFVYGGKNGAKKSSQASFFDQAGFEVKQRLMEVVRTGQGGRSVVGSVVELLSDEWLVPPLHRSRLAAAPQASPA